MRVLVPSLAIVVGSMLAGVASPVDAGEPNPAYALFASHTEGFFGGEAKMTFFLAAEGDLGVEGFHFGACHDGALTLGEDAVFAAPLLEEVDLELLDVAVLDGGWTASVLLAGDGTLTGGELAIFEATYQIVDDVDVAYVEYCETLGDPAVTNRVIAGGDEIEPVTEAGSIEVLFEDGGGGGDAAYFLGASHSEGFFGESAKVSFFFGVEGGEAANGWHFGACHDPGLALEKGSVERGEALFEIEPEVETIEILDGGWTVSTLLSASDAIDGVEREIYHVTYLIVDDVEIAFIEYCESLGDPPVTNRVIVGDREIVPKTGIGSVEVLFEDGGGGGPGEGEDSLYTLSLSDEVGIAGGEATVVVSLTNLGKALDGYQFGVCHGERIALAGDDAVALGAALEGFEFTFHAVTLFDGFWNVGVVFDALGENLLEPGEGLELYLATYDLLEPGEAGVEFCAEGLTPELIRVVAGGEDIAPATKHGHIEILDGSRDFKRGDVDGDGMTFPLVDSIELFMWAFTGGTAPRCLDAADVDDNGSVQALVDGLYLLMWAFQESESPPAPGPAECGEDPSDDVILCVETVECEF